MTVLLNDSIGTFAGGRYADPDIMVGIILGTGTNMSYLERKNHIHNTEKPLKPGHSDEMLINSEWGCYSSHLLPVRPCLRSCTNDPIHCGPSCAQWQQAPKLATRCSSIWSGAATLARPSAAFCCCASSFQLGDRCLGQMHRLRVRFAAQRRQDLTQCVSAEARRGQACGRGVWQARADAVREDDLRPLHGRDRATCHPAGVCVCNSACEQLIRQKGLLGVSNGQL